MTTWKRGAGLLTVLTLAAAGCSDGKKQDSRETGREVGRELRKAGDEASRAAQKAGHELREGVEGLREGLGGSGASDTLDADGGQVEVREGERPADAREPVPRR